VGAAPPEFAVEHVVSRAGPGLGVGVAYQVAIDKNYATGKTRLQNKYWAGRIMIDAKGTSAPFFALGAGDYSTMGMIASLLQAARPHQSVPTKAGRRTPAKDPGRR